VKLPGALAARDEIIHSTVRRGADRRELKMAFNAGHGVDVWSSPAWRQLAVSWIDEQLAAAGSRRTSEVE
jgi:hypothetical protein